MGKGGGGGAAAHGVYGRSYHEKNKPDQYCNKH